MKLFEKFLPYCDHEYANREDNAWNCEEVADEFAIDFYEWRSTSPIKNIDQYTNKEILEIYKKEKGL